MPNELTIGEKIRVYRKAEGLSAQEFAEKYGLNKDNLYKWEKGTKPSDPEDFLKLESILKIENVPHETPNQLHEPETYLIRRRNEKNISKPFMVPLIPVKAQAGYIKNYNNTDYINKLETHAIVPGIDPRGTAWRYFEIEGDSMTDALNERDMVLCNFVPDFDWREIKDNFVYVIITEESVLVKRVVKNNLFSIKKFYF